MMLNDRARNIWTGKMFIDSFMVNYTVHCYHYSVFYICCHVGTGVVTSVPSDSPDDFAALRDLKKKEVRFFSKD